MTERPSPLRCVLWDFGDTLADERWMLAAPEGSTTRSTTSTPGALGGRVYHFRGEARFARDLEGPLREPAASAR